MSNKRLVLHVSAIAFFVGASFCQAKSEDEVVAIIDDKIQITQNQLEPIILQHKQKLGQPQITKADKIKLLHDIIKRQLILQNKDLIIYRKDLSVRKKVEDYENNLLIGKFLQDRIGTIEPSEKELKEFYNNNHHEFKEPAKVEARHILLRTRADAEKVYTLVKKGSDFGKLAQEFSIDLPRARQEGKMSEKPISRGEAAPALDRVLFTMNEGEVSEIVETPYGYHIILVVKVYLSGLKKFSEVESQIKHIITQQKSKAAYGQLVKKLEDNANIKIFEDRL